MVSAESIAIGIGGQFFFVVAETETLFFKFYSFFPTSWGNTCFYKLENKPGSSKLI